MRIIQVRVPTNEVLGLLAVDAATGAVVVDPTAVVLMVEVVA